MDAKRLYESPFTDMNELGLSGIFKPAEVREIVDILDRVKQNAAA